ncbi:MAG: formate/nitrite transporter family protein [Clostridia bacterium]|nr:formate/nitrite transporter family protein [Clostridia bacterium]
MKKIIWNFVNGLLAGIMIAVGGTVFLACFGDGSMVNKTIGAFFFSIALLSICYKGYSLYTGKIGFIPEKHDGEAFSVLLWGLLGNLIATVVLGYALRAAIPAIGGVAETLCTARLTQEWWQTLIRGIFCGILMYMAVSIYRDKKTISGILFCVPVFILAGFEHSVANMFYFGAAGMFFSVKSIIYLAIVVAGNTIGGMLMPILAMIKPKEA